MNTPRKPKHKCQTPYCRNNKAPKKSRCHKCNQRKFRQKHPVAAKFADLRSRAKRRGIVFTLTLEEFTKTVEGSDYIQQTEVKPQSLQIDRINCFLGYEAGNIQVITTSENAKKGNAEKVLRKNKSQEIIEL